MKQLLLAMAVLAGLAAAPPPRTVMVAGDASLPVFDNAVAALSHALGDPPGVRLSALAPPGSAPATLPAVIAAIRNLRPAPGQGCLVFVTSHGGHDRGLYLSRREEFLTPAALDRALEAGCGAAPTVVIASGCYSGGFAQGRMRRPNRAILTAARADRPSFGCTAGREFTVYDQCLLAAIRQATTWPQVDETTRACVSVVEQSEDETPSEPQHYFGAAVAALAVPEHGH